MGTEEERAWRSKEKNPCLVLKEREDV